MATIATKENLNPLEQPGDWFTPRRIGLAFAALFLLNLLLRVFYLRYDFVNGDEAVLLGRQGADTIRVEELAEWLGTIPYEILTMINTRVPRLYVE